MLELLLTPIVIKALKATGAALATGAAVVVAQTSLDGLVGLAGEIGILTLGLVLLFRFVWGILNQQRLRSHDLANQLQEADGRAMLAEEDLRAVLMYATELRVKAIEHGIPSDRLPSMPLLVHFVQAHDDGEDG